MTDIFLDRVSGRPPTPPTTASWPATSTRYNAGSSVWLNPGQYPDQSYMSIGDVVMVFEGTYAQYLGLQVPGWAGSYPASKFAHTVYATPAPGLSRCSSWPRSRRAGHVYVTDRVREQPLRRPAELLVDGDSMRVGRLPSR